MTYPSTVLTDTPLTYLRLGEASGTTAVDSSGNTRNASYVGPPTLGTTGLMPSETDTAITCNGNSQAVSFTYASWQDASSTFTVEAWIKPSFVTSTRVIASRQDVAVGTGVWTLRLEGTALKFYNWNSGGTLQTALSAATVFAVGSVYHVVAVFTPSGTRAIYVNGVLDVSGAASTILTVSTPLRFGADGNGPTYAGVVDEVAYYGTALTGTRIAAHYAAGIAAPSGVTVAVPQAAAVTAHALAPSWNEIIPATSDTTNAGDGRSCGGIGVVEVTYPVVAAPPGVTLGEKYDKAIAYPDPVMDNGRPT